MEFKSHALKIFTLLSQYQNIWSKEIMNEFPDGVKHYPLEWLEILKTLDEDQLYQFDSKVAIKSINDSSLMNFLNELDELCQIKEIPKVPELPLENWAFHGVKKKKKHEIQRITPVLKSLKDKKLFDCVVDIGGGVGHLSRVLSHYHQIPSISIDQNLEFQNIGKERLNKFRKLDGARDVEFINITFGQNEDDPSYQEKITNIYNNRSLTLGLHSCGNLSNILITNTIHHKACGLLSFGCCYYKMIPEVNFPTSEFYKKEKLLVLNQFSLTLATRAHCPTDRQTYETKKRVKNYRYALHLLLMKKFNILDAYDVGECHTRVYFEDFHVYAKSKLDYLKIKHEFSNEDLDQFYENSETQEELRILFLCNLIRWRFGRALELHVLLDRCIRLEENDFSVTLESYFNETESPRNLGILAIKK